MKRFENPTIKVSMFRREDTLTASGTQTAVEFAQQEAAKMGADMTFTIKALW